MIQPEVTELPFYDYYCAANGKTVEVFHPAKKRFKTWREVCRAAGIDLGGTDGRAGVVRLVSQVTPYDSRLKGLDKDQPHKRMI